MSVYGNFCSFNCAMTFIGIYVHNKDLQWRYKDNLYMLYKIFNSGKYPEYIAPSPSKFEMEVYGGMLSQSDYRSIVDKLCEETMPSNQ